jgi:hypothetical protein
VIKQAGSRSDGNVWEGVIIKRGKEWIGETEGILGDGAKVVSRFVTVFQKDGNRLVWEGEFSIDGEKQDPLRDVYEKVEEKTPLKEFGDLIVGRWIGDVTLIRDWPGIGKRGEKVVAYWTVSWAADGRALRCEWQGGQGGGTSLIAWDAATKRIVELTARTDGVTGQAVITKQGKKWVSKATGSLANGTKASHEVTIEFEDGGSEMRVHGDVIVGGEKADPLDDVYRRLSD